MRARTTIIDKSVARDYLVTNSNSNNTKKKVVEKEYLINKAITLSLDNRNKPRLL